MVLMALPVCCWMLWIMPQISHSPCFAGAGRQVTYFIRHHRKATALLNGTGRFDRGVEGQEIGLLGNRGDDADDPTDFL